MGMEKTRNGNFGYRGAIGLMKSFAQIFLIYIQFYSPSSYSQENSQDFLTPEEKAWVQDHPVIRSTNDRSWAPIDFVRNGKAAGFSIDYLDLVASKVGLRVEYYDEAVWSEQLRNLQNRNLDVSHSITHLEEREAYLDFTKPYLHLPTAFFGREGMPRINSKEDLLGYRVGVINQWGVLDPFIADYPNLDLILLEDENQALLALSSSTIDIFVGSIAVMNYAMSNSLISGFEVIGFVDSSSKAAGNEIHLAGRNDWPELTTILQKGMEQITEEEFTALTSKWQTAVLSNKNVDFTDEELSWLEDNKVIHTAVDPTAYPWDAIDQNGEVDGIAGDYLKLFEDMLDVKFEWVGNNNFQEGLDAVVKGDAMMLSSIIQTPERMEDYLFSPTYLTISNVIFTRTGEEIRGTLETLSGRTVALPRDFAIVEFVRRDFPEINIIYANSSAEALVMVSDGKADAFIGSISSGSRVMAEYRLENIVITGDTPYKFGIAMAVNQDLSILQSILRKALASIDEDDRELITQKWLSLPTYSEPDYAVISRIIGAAIFVLSVVLIWALSLRREIRRRKIVELNLVKMQKNAEFARFEAEQANNAKSNFLANMSHEIRTPLNAIIGFSEIISSEIFGAIKNEKYRQYIEDIRNSGEHLADVINDILDLSKIESGKWDLDERESIFSSILSEALKMVENAAQEKSIRLEMDVPENFETLKVRGDKNCLTRILLNLLINAVKFTPKNGIIKCQIIQTDDGGLMVSIKDNGIGIARDRLEHVLNPFEQASADTHVNEMGTGLGLSIVKELVDLHGGTFNLESKLDVGTNATFTIPEFRVLS